MMCRMTFPYSSPCFLHIARESESHSVLRRRREKNQGCTRNAQRWSAEECYRRRGALVKGFKDLTIPHPLSLSFISNNQAWPQNIPLDGKKTCCLSASHSSLDCQSWVFLLKSSVTFMASNTKHSPFFN